MVVSARRLERSITGAASWGEAGILAINRTTLCVLAAVASVEERLETTATRETSSNEHGQCRMRDVLSFSDSAKSYAYPDKLRPLSILIQVLEPAS